MKEISRSEARSAGLKNYFTGRPCNLGGIAERDVSEKKCQCDAHKDKRSKSAQARYLKNKENRIARAVEWSKSNAEKRKLIAREWAKRNSEVVKSNTHKRRANKLNATPPWFGELDDLVMVEAHDLAAKREQATGIRWEVDHTVPLAGKKVCGLHVWNNIQVIPMSINRRKSNSHTVA